MKLVIVETPAQAKLLTGILGEGWRIEPCYGFVRDLPADVLGIDTNADFRPTFVITRGKGNLVRRLMKAVRESEAVYAALPPGRSGEAIAWHVLALSPDAKDKRIYRVSLLALTPEAIHTAFTSPRPLNLNWIEAALADRIVDRLVGYAFNANASEALWSRTTVNFDTMTAVRLLIERDRAISSFTPESRWTASVEFVVNGERFQTQLLNAKGALLALRSTDQVAQLQALLNSAVFWVDKSIRGIKSSPAPDALTSTDLIETAGTELDLPPNRILALTGILYEAGWITHPLADTAAELQAAAEAARAYIRREYGTEYLLPAPRDGGGIAPTDVNHTPEELPGYGAALYALIWRRFIAAQMSPTLHRSVVARICAGPSVEKPYPLELRAAVRTPYFDGWRRILGSGDAEKRLPRLTEGTTLEAAHIHIDALSIEPPVGYKAHSLVKALSEIGIPCPGAAQAVEHVQEAGYAAAEDGALVLTERGRELAEYLGATFGELTSSEYRAELATDIERIAAGEGSRIEVLNTFWARFGGALRLPETTPTDRAIGEHKPVILRPAEEV